MAALEKATSALTLDHDNHTEVVAAAVDIVAVAPVTAYWSHGLVVAELPIFAEVAGLAVPAVPAAEVVVDHYSEPTRDFSVY